MKTVKEVLELSAAYLAQGGSPRPRRDGEELLAAVLKVKRLDLYMQFDRPLEEKELELCRNYLKRRRQREPLEYILQEVEFFQEKLFVSPEVLIPRQETELMLARAVEMLSSLSLEGLFAWDVCTGSGCLGIGLKKRFSSLAVTLSDISTSALAIAQKNAERAGAAIEILQGDLLVPFKGKKADILLCNPPYVSEEEYIHLEKDVKEYEPKLALLGGKEGLDFYIRLASELPEYLNPRAKVFLEIGATQGKRLEEIFSSPCWTTRRIEKDFSGHDRFFFLEFE